MSLTRILARARNYITLAMVVAVVMLFATSWFLLDRVSSLSAGLATERAKTAQLMVNYQEFQADFELVRATLDIMAVQERDVREVQNHEEAFVRSSTVNTEGNFFRGWNNFFEFLRRNDNPDAEHDR